MYSLRSHRIPRHPIRQMAAGSILKPFQGFQCLIKPSVNILKRGRCFCVCNSCFILLVNSSMFLVYFTELLRPMVYILILCMCIWIWMNSVLEDDHLREIKLQENKLNLRSRCLGTDHILYFSPLSPNHFPLSSGHLCPPKRWPITAFGLTSTCLTQKKGKFGFLMDSKPITLTVWHNGHPFCLNCCSEESAEPWITRKYNKTRLHFVSSSQLVPDVQL